MRQYELSRYDFEVLDKLMANGLDGKLQPLNVRETVTLERLKERFVKAEEVIIKTEK